MVTLIAILKVKEGKMDEVISKLKVAVPHIKKTEPKCLEYIPHRIKGDDNKIIFYEKYADQEAVDLHAKNLPENLKDILPLVEPDIDIKTCFDIFDK
ncbi:MAG: antibiotic biosynthesis monooxygenase [Leptospirales bacterium]|nr:antibiotic biosynthesis monooxygenase [Leptospirales bacterium]